MEEKETRPEEEEMGRDGAGSNCGPAGGFSGAATLTWGRGVSGEMLNRRFILFYVVRMLIKNSRTLLKLCQERGIRQVRIHPSISLR